MSEIDETIGEGATPAIDRFLNVQSAYVPSFGPDGRSLAFLTNLTGINQLWHIDMAEGETAPAWPTQLTFATERVMTATYAPFGPPRLLISRDAGGNENAQLFLIHWDADGAVVETALTGGHAEAMHTPGRWAPDGRSFLFAANRRHPGLFDLYRQSPDGSPATLLWQNETPGYLGYAGLSPDGRHITLSRIGASARHEWLEITVATGEARALHPSDRPARYLHPVYSPDGRFIYVNTDLDDDFMHIARLDRESQSLETVVRRDWDVETPTLSPDGRTLAYIVNEAGVGRLERLDLTSEKTIVAPTPGTAPGVAGGDGVLSFAPDGRRLAFSYSSAVGTFDVFVWTFETEQVTAVTRSSHGGLSPASFATPALIHYPTFDGRHIPAWFLRPETPPPHPVVVIVHGGPEGQSRPYFNFLAQYLVQGGFAVLVPNVRGSSGYGKAYAALDNVRLRMDSVADLAHAAHWLRQQPEVDGERIAVYGGSYGGFMVLAGMTAYPDLWAAGVNIVGISNLATFLENTSEYRRAHRESEYGSLADDRDFLESIAPINHIDNIRAPLLVIHGANDPRVPVSEAEQLVAALEKRDVPVELLIFEDEGHGIARLANKRIAYPAITAFLERHLGRIHGASDAETVI